MSIIFNAQKFEHNSFKANFLRHCEYFPTKIFLGSENAEFWLKLLNRAMNMLISKLCSEMALKFLRHEYLLTNIWHFRYCKTELNVFNLRPGVDIVELYLEWACKLLSICLSIGQAFLSPNLNLVEPFQKMLLLLGYQWS